MTSSALVSLWCSGGVVWAQTSASPPGGPIPPTQSAQGTLPTIAGETTKKRSAKKQSARPPAAPPAQNGTPSETPAQTIARWAAMFNLEPGNIYTHVGVSYASGQTKRTARNQERSSRAEEDEGEIDTDNLFGFTIGTDVGELGEREFQAETTAGLGKRAGTYTALSQMLSVEFVPVENLKLSVGPSFSLYNIFGVPGLDDRNQLGFQGTSFEARYRLLDRKHSAFGLAIDVEPQWGLFEENSGEPADQYGVDFTLAMDKELVPDRVVGAFNLLYQPETTHVRATDMCQREATIGVAAALMGQVRPGLLIGAEARYLRKYEDLSLDSFAGHAFFLGPTVFVKLSDRAFVSASLSAQVAGRSADDPGPLDLTNFQRYQTKFQLGFNF